MVYSSRLSAKRTEDLSAQRIEACGYCDVSFDTLRLGGPLSPRVYQQAE
jgi:hypothetical protein